MPLERPLLLLHLIFGLLQPGTSFLFGGLERCYGDLGCFRIDGDFLERPVQLLPLSPEKLKTRFLLNTRENSSPASEDEVKYLDEFSVVHSHFNPSRPTKIIVHGFMDFGGDKWLVGMSKAFLMKEDVNVIRVDWRIGAMIPYTQASANTRLIGAEIALLIQRICSWTGAKAEDFHILGHSLGSHVAGYAGERIENLGRITGLDPAEPYFQGYGPAVRLDPTDASFVDVIHSDAASFYDPGGAIVNPDKGLGMLEPVGHVDFYPNAGKEQPGCSKSLIDKILGGGIVTGDGSIFDVVACSHMRAIYLYTESINSDCPFQAYSCSSYSAFLAGLCISCGTTGSKCASMGHRAINFKPLLKEEQNNVKMYLKTGTDLPRCRHNYVVEVDLAQGLGLPQQGLLHGELVGNLGSTADVALSEKEETLTPGLSYRYFGTSAAKVGKPKNFQFWWEYKWSLTDPSSWPHLRKPQVYVKSIKAKTDSSKVNFCAFKTPVKPGKLESAVFFPSSEDSGLCSN